ncbi:MAG: carboxypeptidase regulatory-like domain-containing protein [Deltaproteobacteria bacterium]|nr:carboxypeptidase regulatory-like domain-containing protein [Deltaproteobacteria bacterium]
MPNLQCSGKYEIQAYIPSENAKTSKAKYEIKSDVGWSNSIISQLANPGKWVALGGSGTTYSFTKGASDRYVKLTDVTGEISSKGLFYRIAFDAIKWIYKEKLSNMGFTLTAPNSGTAWSKDDTCLSVKWSTQGDVPGGVRIHLYKGGTSPSQFVKSLIGSTPNNGSACVDASALKDQPLASDYVIGISNNFPYCDGYVWAFSNSFKIAAPDLTGYQLPGWGGKLVGSGVSGTNSNSALYTCKVAYFDVGIKNEGNGDNKKTISNRLLIDGINYGTWTESPLSAGSYTSEIDMPVSGITAGTHTVKVEIDYPNNIPESDESDNAVSGSFAWQPCNNPSVIITSPANGSSTTSSSVTVSGTCNDSDGDLKTYIVTVNGTSLPPGNISGGSAAFAKTVSLNVGSNKIEATCTDQQGLVSNVAMITVTRTQLGGIAGTVTSTKGGAIAVASVTANGPVGVTTSTASDGSYSFTGLQPGTYTVTASSAGYYSTSQSVNVQTNTTAIANFSLVPVPKPILSVAPTAVSVTMPSGSLNGTQQVIIQNNGDANLQYWLVVPPPSWLTIKRNGGALVSTSVSPPLAPGAKDTLTFYFNSNQVSSNQAALLVVGSNDTAKGDTGIDVTMTIKASSPPPPQYPAPSTPTFTPTFSGSCTLINACAKDPVNTATGNYTYSHTDLNIRSRGPSLLFARTYNSFDPTIGPLGLGWTHSFHVYALEYTKDDGSPGDVYIRWGTGRTDWYQRNADGTYTPAPGLFDAFVKNGDGSFTLVEKNKTVWNFQGSGRLASVADRHGNAMTLTYEDAEPKRLVAATNALGEQLIFSYQSGDPLKLADVWDVQGNRKILFTYEGDRLTTVTDANGNPFTFEYDAADRLTKIIERDGKPLVTNAYSANDPTDRRVLTQQDGLGNTTAFSYDTPTPWETTVTDPATEEFPGGRKHIYSYDALYRLRRHTAPSGMDIVTYDYNDNHQRTKMTDANGKVTLWEYDPRGNLTKITEAEGAPEEVVTTWTYYPGTDLVDLHVTPLGLTLKHYYEGDDLTKVEGTGPDIEPFAVEYTYLPTGEVATVKDPMQYVTTFDYNGKGELEQIVSPPTTASPGGEIASFGYDSSHRPTSVADPYLQSLGKAALYTYDKNDRITKTTDGLTRETTITPDKRDLVEKIAAPNGIVTYAYDDAGRLVSVTTPTGTVTYGYNASHERTSATSPGNHTTTYSYDPLGYLAKVTDPTNRSLTLDADPMGALKSLANSLNHTVGVAPDLLGRAKEITDPVGRKIELQYNDAGQVTSRAGLFDPANPATKVTTTTVYDVLGRLRKITTPANGEMAAQYNLNADIIGITNPNGHTTSWVQGPLGRPEAERFDGVTKRTFGYYPGGRIKTATNAKSETTTFLYDEAARLKEIQYADGAKRTIAFKGQTDRVEAITLVETDGTTRSRSFTYDSAGRVATATDPWGNTISYTYWPDGQVKTITYPGNKTVSYAYDDAGRLATVTDWLTPPGVTTYGYDTAGRLDTITYPNGATAVYAYENDGRVKSIAHRKADGTILASQTVGYDGRAHVKAIELVPEPTAALEGKELDYTPNAEDQYAQIGGLNLEYDPVGRLTTPFVDGGPGMAYTFDVRDHLAQATTTGGTVSYISGPEGERIEQSAGGATTRYVVDTTSRLSSVVAELDGANTPTAYYIYGVGLLARIPANGQNARYYHQDAQQNIAALTDASGNVTDSYFYHPFGQVLTQTGSTPNPYRFAGALGVENDPTGLYYMRARYYDPAQGRFISKDPIGMAGGMNLYGYVGNNPLRAADPLGLFSWKTFGTGLLELGKAALSVVETVGNAFLAGGSLAIFQPEGTAALGLAAVGNLDDAFVNTTNSFNNIVGAFSDKPAEKLITQGPYREFLQATLGSTKLLDVPQEAADVASFLYETPQLIKETPKIIEKIGKASKIYKNAKSVGGGSASGKYILKKGTGLVSEYLDVLNDATEIISGEDILEHAEDWMMSPQPQDTTMMLQGSYFNLQTTTAPTSK